MQQQQQQQQPPFPAPSPTRASSPSPLPTELVPIMSDAFDGLMSAVFKATASSAELVGPVQTFLVTAKTAERYLHSWTLSEREERMRDDAELERDIARLEGELERTTQLLQLYTARMADWAERYRRLEDDNERVQEQLYASPPPPSHASAANASEAQRR